MKQALLGLALSLVLGACRSAPDITPDGRRPYLDAALQAADWLLENANPSEVGTAWLPDPTAETPRGWQLYSGSAGVVLFFVEAYRHTENEAFLEIARQGADGLLWLLQRGVLDSGGMGLYVGMAGIGFVLQETYKATGDLKYRNAARRCVEKIHACAREIGAGVEWGAVTDMISGSAGTGLFLLYAAREFDHPASRELAARAGQRLIELGEPAEGGLRWRMNPEYPRLMPNFSHGTAGIAYFLARLHEETGENEFLEAALAGASYLVEIGQKEDGGFLVFHHEPDGKDLFYLGWCHGPVGTSRLFYRLHRITGKGRWKDLLARSARSVRTSGIPQRKTPGFWNNVGQCCGTAGVLEYFLNLHAFTDASGQLLFSRELANHLLRTATEEGIGLKWVQAEHRSRPELLAAQTGYMQGAAGIGMALLHIDAYLNGGPTPIRLPDDPY